MTAKIKLNAASGGGSFSLQAPSSSANNRVFTLPDSADATLLTTNTATGKVINYAQKFETAVVSDDVQAGTITNDLIFLDYTAASSSNKLLIMASLCVTVQNGANGKLFGYLYIGGSVSAAIGDAASNRLRVSFQNQNFNDVNMSPASHNYLLSSPATSSTRYSYKFSHTDVSGDGYKGIILNKPHGDTDNNTFGRSTSSITIMEFAP